MDPELQIALKTAAQATTDLLKNIDGLVTDVRDALRAELESRTPKKPPEDDRR